MKFSYLKAAFLAIAALTALVFGRALYLNHFTLQLDQAYMVESIDTTFKYGVPLTQLTKTSIEAIRTLLAEPADVVCKASLPIDDGKLMNIYVWHAFPILYLIAPFEWIFDGKVIVAALTVLSFLGMIVVVFVTARRHGVPLVAAMSFAFLVSAHPAWSYSAFGQFYPDRIFLVIGLLYVVALVSYLQDYQWSRWTMLLTAVLATMCTERAGIMICGYTLTSLVLYRGIRFRRTDLWPICIAVAAGVYAMLYMRLVQQNENYVSFASPFITQAGVLLRNGLDPLTAKFLLVNALGLGLLACFSWRLGLVAAGSMLPNLLGSIGGAEKIGWSIHYHTLYFTFLVAAALYGLIQFLRWFPDRRTTVGVSIVMLGFGAALLLMNPYETNPLIKLSQSNINNYAPLKAFGLVTNTLSGRGVVNQIESLRAAAAKIPVGATVSTIEGMVPVLYDKALPRHIHFYPLGLDAVEYLALPYTTLPDGQLQFSGAVSYVGPEAQKKIDRCMNERALRLGFRPTATVPFSPGAKFGIAILHRE